METPGRQKAHLKWKTGPLVPISNPTIDLLHILSVQLFFVSEEQKGLQKLGVSGK